MASVQRSLSRRLGAITGPLPKSAAAAQQGPLRTFTTSLTTLQEDTKRQSPTQYQAPPLDTTSKSHAERAWASASRQSSSVDPVLQRRQDAERVEQSTIDSLRTAIRESNFSAGWSIYRTLKRNGQLDQLNIKDWNALIRMRRAVEVVWGRSAGYNVTIRDIRGMIEEMKACGIQPDVGTHVLIASVHARAGNIEAIEKEWQMVDAMGEPRPVVARTLTAQAKARSVTHWEEALQELQNMKDEGEDRGSLMGLLNALLTSALQQKSDERYQRAMELGKKLGLEPDGATWDVIIGYEAKRNVPEARRLLNEKARKGFGRTIRSYNYILRGYANMGRQVDALQIFNEMERYKVPANTATYNIMLGAYAASGDAIAVMRIYLAMVAAKINANRQTHQILAQGVGPRIVQEGDVRKIVRQAGGYPNRIMTRGLMEGLYYCREHEKALLVFREYRSEHAIDAIRWPMRAEIYTTAVGAYARQGMLEEAEALFAEMKSHGYHLNKHLAAALLSMYTKPERHGDPVFKAKCKEVFETLQNDPKNLPDASTYALMVQSEVGPEDRLNDAAIGYLKEFGERVEMGVLDFSPSTQHLMRYHLNVVGEGNWELGLERVKKGDVQSWGRDPQPRVPWVGEGQIEGNEGEDGDAVVQGGEGKKGE
ncbi:hypothetical protein HDV00_006832 [Rhizophlyctis rosea]|nr:hypothetical protein HDV00_006832 [Rhizophlyctis rosea]